jgi:hypothetical protein
VICDYNDEDDDWFDDGFSEDEDLDLNELKYMNFATEPTIVKDLMDDLKDPKFMLSTLQVLAWNIQNTVNLDTVVKNNYTQTLLDMVMELMNTEASLPIIRSCSHLTQHLATVADIKITWAQYKDILNVLVAWTKGVDSTKPVPHSPEIGDILSKTLSNLTPKVPKLPNESEQCFLELKGLMAHTSSPKIRDNLKNFLNTVNV